MFVFIVTGLLPYTPDNFTQTDFLANAQEHETISGEEEVNQCLLHVAQLVSRK
jgi:hypothetical protein